MFYLSGSSKTLLVREECVFCRKQKTQKGSGYEKLVACTTEASATCLLEFRDNADNSYTHVQMARLDTPTVIAEVFKYHRTCYQSWCKQKDKHDKEKDPKDASQEIRKRCFKELIVRKLGDKISFFQKKNGSSEIMDGTGDCLSFNSNYNLNQSDIVCSCAKMIREELLGSKNDFASWTPPENELSTASSPDLPVTKLLLSSIPTKTKSKRNDRLTPSISQDLLYNVTKGKVRMKKHVQLGISIKRKTGSAAVLR